MFRSERCLKSGARGEPEERSAANGNNRPLATTRPDELNCSNKALTHLPRDSPTTNQYEWRPKEGVGASLNKIELGVAQRGRRRLGMFEVLVKIGH